MPIPPDIEALAEGSEPVRNSATLEHLRKRAAYVRDETIAITESQERLDERKKALRQILERELVDLFHEVGTDLQGLPAEGNMPAYDVSLKEWVSAKIPDQFKDAAHDWFEEQGHGDIVRHTFTVSLGVDDEARANKLRKLLQKEFPDEYLEERKIHSSTLLAFVKEQRRLGEVLPAEILGINSGDIVLVEERKERKSRAKSKK